MDYMDFVADIIDSNNNQEFNALVPFPYLEPQEGPQEQPPSHHPTDSDTARDSSSNSSSSCSTTNAMDSSLSSVSASGKSEGVAPMASSSDNKPPSAETKRRISYQDEMQSIDIESVADPMMCIKQMLDGLVAELKVEASDCKDAQSKLPPNDEKQAKTDENEAAGLASEQQGVAKRARPNDEAGKEQDDASKISKPKSSSDSSPEQSPIETIMGWMDTFQDSEPIQLICLQALPSLLEHNTLRYHAQTGGLASIVFYNMAAFPENFLLQLTALHTLVVLLRPLGAMEGTLVKGGSTAKNVKTAKGPRRRSFAGEGKIMADLEENGEKSNSLLMWEENGVRVMLDTLRSYSHDRYLQAMGCWAMVNAALYPSLKKSLLKLGGVYVVTNAMMLHPNAEAVQFRGLFALINFVIPGEIMFI
jgi:hypothetical protein